MAEKYKDGSGPPADHWVHGAISILEPYTKSLT